MKITDFMRTLKFPPSPFVGQLEAGDKDVAKFPVPRLNEAGRRRFRPGSQTTCKADYSKKSLLPKRHSLQCTVENNFCRFRSGIV
jgi:hypothetical protein